MKEQSDRKYIDNLIRHTRESIWFFSNVNKKARERMICAAFLRCLGIKFTSDEIQPNKEDPPDVFFKTAYFEVRELYDTGRKRHDEYKGRLNELERAKSIEDTLVPFHQPKPISYEQLLDEMLIALNGKASEYGKSLCSKLDALVYIGLPSRFLDIKSTIPENAGLSIQGWRSVSFVIPPYSHIVFCGDSAPQFIVAFAGQTKWAWKDPDGFFDL